MNGSDYEVNIYTEGLALCGDEHGDGLRPECVVELQKNRADLERLQNPALHLFSEPSRVFTMPKSILSNVVSTAESH